MGVESTGSQPAVRRLFSDRHPLFRREHQQNFSRRLVSLVIGAATFCCNDNLGDGSEILRNKIKSLTPKLEKLKKYGQRTSYKGLEVWQFS